MKNVIHVNPRARPPAMEKCPQCGKPDLEIRTDGAYLCKHCFYTTKSRIDSSLLQQWTHSIFNLEDETPPPEERVRGGRMAGEAERNDLVPGDLGGVGGFRSGLHSRPRTRRTLDKVLRRGHESRRGRPPKP